MGNRVAGPSFVAALLVIVAQAVSIEAQQAQEQQQDRGVQVGVPQGSAADAARQRQLAAQKQRPAPPPSAPAPRDENNHILIGPTSKAMGLWLPDGVRPNPLGLKEVPMMPWATALVAERRRQQLEPHTRCKPSGVARVFLTPYGVEIVEIPEMQQVFIFDVGGPHTWRVIYLDGRAHPEDYTPDYYGHSIGWWEGDTLVVDTVGFNEGFWLDRGQLPHTEKLRTLERFTRTNFDTLRYELTIDDPGAYTGKFGGAMDLKWEKDTELFEYVCQEANYAHELMVGQGTSVDRSTIAVP